jgi:hypothetical protein
MTTSFIIHDPSWQGDTVFEQIASVNTTALAVIYKNPDLCPASIQKERNQWRLAGARLESAECVPGQKISFSANCADRGPPICRAD